MSMKRRAENFNDLLKLRSAYRRLAQVTWSIKVAEERFSINSPNDEAGLLDIYIAMKLEVKKILKDINEILSTK